MERIKQKYLETEFNKDIETMVRTQEEKKME